MAFPTHKKYSYILTPFEKMMSINDPRRLKEADLLAALTILEGHRDQFIKKLQSFQDRRKYEKQAGKRNPTKDEIEELFGFVTDKPYTKNKLAETMK